MSPHPRILALLALAAIALAPCRGEEPAAPKQPIPTEIQSVSLKAQNDGKEAYFLFTGDVKLTATNLLLQCDELQVHAERQGDTEEEIGQYGGIKKIIALGNVKIVQAEREATCGRAEVQPDLQRIVLTQDPVVIQAGTKLEAAELIIERGQGTILVNPTATNKKLRFTGPAIGDIGFEDKAPAAKPQAEAPANEGQAAEEAPSDKPTPANAAE